MLLGWISFCAVNHGEILLRRRLLSGRSPRTRTWGLPLRLLTRRSLRFRRTGGRLAGYYRLRAVVFLGLLVRNRFGHGLGYGRRMELRSQVDQQALFHRGQYAHQELILRVVQKLAELLETVSLPIEIRLLRSDPFSQNLVGSPVLHLQAMRFEHVAKNWDRLLRLCRGFLGGLRGIPAPDHVAALFAR